MARAGLILLLALVAGALVPAEARAGAPARRELRRRPLQVTDATSTMVPEVHVAAGVPTTLAFRVAIKPDAGLGGAESWVARGCSLRTDRGPIARTQTAPC